MQCVGIEIGGTKLQLVLGDEGGVVHQRIRLKVDRSKGASGIRKQIEEALPRLIASMRVDAIGIGFGGPVDWKTARICRSHQIEGWSEFDLGRWLNPLADVPVFADNDANVAALGEALQGAGIGFNPVFYVTLGSGVGGGLVLDGNIYHGAKPGESEIGHARLDRDGTIVEERCSGWAVDAKIRDHIKKEPHGIFARLVGGSAGGEAKHLTAALQAGDAAAESIIHDIAADLAFGLSHVAHLFHPEIIILGGGLSAVGEPLRAAVEKALTGFVMDAFAPGPRVALAALADDAVPVGALRLAHSRLRAKLT